MRTYLLTFCAILFLGCLEKSSDLILEDTDKKLVLVSILSSDDVLQIRVMHTISPLDTSINNTVLNADVKLFENNQFRETLLYSTNGYYKSSSGFRPTRGNKYYFNVVAPGFNSVETDPVIIPDTFSLKIEIKDSIYIERLGGSDAPTYIEALFRFNVSHSLSSENYFYLLEASSTFEKGTSRDFFRLPALYDGFSQISCNVYHLGSKIIYSSTCLTKSPFIQLDANGSTYFKRLGKLRKIDGQISIINEAYFKYLRDIYFQQLIPQDKLFFQSFNLHSNVNGGIGIVGVKSSQKLNLSF